jgi:hypothetical protein
MNKFQLGRVLTDFINRLNTKLGTIDNLHGNVLDASFEETKGIASGGWYYVQGTGNIPRDLLVNAAFEDRLPFFIGVSNGVASFSEVTSVEGPNTLIYTGVIPAASSKAGSTVVPISIEAPGAEISLYVNDVYVLRNYNALNVETMLPVGKSVIQVLVKGGLVNTVKITIPQELSIGHLPNAPAAPIWHSTPLLFGFFGTTEMSAAVRLRWQDSGAAGSWNIERTSYRLLGNISAVSQSGNQFIFTVAGSHAGISGEVVVDQNTVVGTIVSAVDASPNTTITVNSTLVLGSWTSKNFWVSEAQSVIGSIEREDAIIPEDGIFGFTDTGIIQSVPYSYRLSSVHPLHLSLEGAWSEKQTIFSQDNVAPGSVTVTSSLIRNNGEVVVNYAAPNDIDYMGVRVYRVDAGVYTPVMSDFGRPGQADQLSFFPSGTGTYWLRSFDWARNVQAEGTGASYTYDSNFADPRTSAVLQRISRTEHLVTLSAIPTGSTIFYRSYLVGESVPDFTTYVAPLIYSVDELADRIIEYYGQIVNGITTIREPSHTLLIDKDHTAEVYINTLNGGHVSEQPNANDMKMSVAVDDDLAHWNLWTRLGAWPTTDGTNTDLANNLNDAYKRGRFSSTVTSFTHRAATGTWYIVVQGEDFNGYKGPVDSRTFVVTGSATTAPELYNFTVAPFTVSGSNRQAEIRWDHTTAIQTDYGAGTPRYKVHVWEALDSEPYVKLTPGTDDTPTRRAAEDWDDTNTNTTKGGYRGSTFINCTKGSPSCNFRTYYYKIELWDTQTTTKLATYYTQYGAYFTPLA